MKTKVGHNIEYRFPERETQISSYFQKSLEVTFLNNGRMQTTSWRLTTGSPKGSVIELTDLLIK